MCMTLNPQHAAEIPFENSPYLHASPAGKAAALRPHLLQCCLCGNNDDDSLGSLCLPMVSMYLKTKLLKHQPEKSNGGLDKKQCFGLHRGTQNIYQL